MTAVARAWASGRGGKPVMADDALTRAAILPDWLLDRQRDAGAIEVPEADLPVVSLFLALDTQWRRHPMTGHRLGLDYAAIRPTADLFGVALNPAMMADLRAMEAAAIAELVRAAR